MTDEVQPGDGGRAAERTGLEKFLKEAGWASYVVTLLGSTTLTGFISNATTKPRRAGLSEFTTLVTAGLAALALTLGVAIFVAIYQQSDPKPIGFPLAVLAICCIGGGTLAANVVGYMTVGFDELERALSTGPSGNPVVTVAVLLGAFIVAYGWIVAAQGAVVGYLLGRWAAILAAD
ncbi:hypothetical protein [Kribbella speibonae]|uniref:Uncharacterized protein n=1 Tax=Kribbella speibonae TaxID=1572660 RepID=A0ABY2AB21_9ACTN|nr:hypothetical protein [Kribbella speibonae]TCC26903.1 hypothetical protein E0H58_02540 [Kribbella speibonae]